MNCEFARLEQEALLHLTGPDALGFLQGQTTCDTRLIDREHAQPGAYCTPQGRVVCDFLLCELGADHYGLRMRRDIREESGKTFGKYIVFSKATLEAARDDWPVFGAWGPGAAQALKGVFGELPAERYGALSGDGFVLVRMDEKGELYECYLDTARGDYPERLAGAMESGSEAAWQARQIESGLARIEAATAGEHVPQTLNYDLTGHISFKKGCYTGQEVVARLHYRGKPKHRTYRADLPAGTACAVGGKVLDAVTGKPAGTIVNAATAGNAVRVLLEASAEGVANGLQLDDDSATTLSQAALPYSLGSD